MTKNNELLKLVKKQMTDLSIERINIINQLKIANENTIEHDLLLNEIENIDEMIMLNFIKIRKPLKYMQ